MIHKFSFFIVLFGLIGFIQSTAMSSSPFDTQDDVNNSMENASTDLDQLESELFQLESCIKHVQSNKMDELDDETLEACKLLFEKAANEISSNAIKKRSYSPRPSMIRRFFSLNVGKSSPIHQMYVESQKGFKYGK